MRCVGSKIAVIYVTFLSEEKHGLAVDTFRAEIEKRDKKPFYEKKYVSDIILPLCEPEVTADRSLPQVRTGQVLIA